MLLRHFFPVDPRRNRGQYGILVPPRQPRLTICGLLINIMKRQLKDRQQYYCKIARALGQKTKSNCMKTVISYKLLKSRASLDTIC
jgi:hypothetical protein